ncbi:flagellar biosynthesis protein FliQ [Brucella sp. NF 2653]|nr:Flagellar biosynthesis protein FliQ [Brucella abortus S19]EFM61069.1 flagellar biosynthesis protein FliQ [Brucella sp. NF 2653]SPU64383.1 flagellar biosynthesis protein FliQ [Brucella melitensis]
MTLTFVPKIIVIFVVLALTAPFVGAQINAFTLLAYSRIEKGF